MAQRITILDTHTGGEPTRIVLAGTPDLGIGTLVERRTLFREKFDCFRSAIVNEPRGSDVMVGAMLVPPCDSTCVAGVLFFNNVGYLGMCGHGTIGVVVGLGHVGRISAGRHFLETPVGVIAVEYDGASKVSLENVPSYRYRAGVSVQVEGIGPIQGDIAWGGNWFFLVSDHGQELAVSRAAELTDFTWRIRQALQQQGVTGADGGEIDHIELFGPSSSAAADSRNFVLCPGKAYDRSPCGTGTSAKLACLHASGKLKPGEVWKQESITGSIFEGSVRVQDDLVIPRISGTAYVTGEGILLLDDHDPLCWGIR